MEGHLEVSEEVSQVISDEVMIYLHVSLNIVARLLISIMGVVTNVANMIIFSKLGLKDSMSVGLFTLSLTDFLVTSIQFASCIAFMMDFLCPNSGIDGMFLGYYELGWPISAFCEISCWITAMISLERCYCVVYPFKVKQVFTKRRCIAVTLMLYGVYIGIHIPIYLYERMVSVTIITEPRNKTVNSTPEFTLTSIINEKVQLVELILDLFAGVSMWFLSQVIIVVCAVWMGYSLEVTSKVRHSVYSDVRDNRDRQLPVSSKHSSTLSNRERRMVKVVLGLAITLTCCNVPKMIMTIVYYTFPDANSGKQENLSAVFWTLSITFVTLGCSLSFVVYLTLNMRYRQAFSCFLNTIMGCNKMPQTHVGAQFSV